MSERSRENVTFIDVGDRAVIVIHQTSGDDREHPSRIGGRGIGVKVVVGENVLNSCKKIVVRDADVL